MLLPYMAMTVSNSVVLCLIQSYRSHQSNFFSFSFRGQQPNRETFFPSKFQLKPIKSRSNQDQQLAVVAWKNISERLNSRIKDLVSRDSVVG